MALPKTDKPLRKIIEKAIDKIKKIMARFSRRLDDPVWVLKTDQSRINKEIDKYIKSITPVIANSFTGKHVEIISNKALESFAEAMKGIAPTTTNISSANAMAKAINRNQSQLVKSIINQLGSNQRLKAQTLKSMNLAPSLDPKKIVRINGKKFDFDDIDAAWEVLTDQYGKSGQLIFASGKKMPIDQYVDGKLNTLTQEVNNQIVVMEAAKNSVDTVKISSHQSSDSCRLHENEIAFINKLAKQRFIKENPELASRARKMHTLDELKNDPTHIFGFNCKHRIIPFPIDLMPMSRIEDSRQPEPLPKNGKEARERTKKVLAS